MNNKELVKSGHELAKAISSDTPLIEIAKMVSNLATQLDVQIARSNQLSIALEAAEKRIAELSSAIIAPGVMRCAGCGLVLTKNIISMSAGTITAGDSKTELCPNGCGPLWPVTWKEQAIEMRDSSEQWFEDLQSARKRIAELEALEAKTVWSDIDMSDADCFTITRLHEIIYASELKWPEAKLLARFMHDVKQRAGTAKGE
ncbi:hypothetical protein [Enterobacter kobei]|uniref:hypothetical protein n=1 Tax=Enterobacter kobei TaxID=208224 RepID=UPI000991C225|nr:hypothetical protein [Enterobacter kobei]OOV75023.1 hypothetical protein B1742_09910 [Enterobacter kobei]